MNKYFKPLSFLLAIAFLISACIPAAVEVAQAAPAAMKYEDIIGKPISDQSVANFIASNNCNSSGPLQLCHTAGLALWMDNDRVVRAAYLYTREFEKFAAYKGELPFGLASNDTRADVERKLGQPKVIHAPQAEWQPGLPDEGVSPDHTHYWAIYRRFGMTIIYDSPSANDQNANIDAILVNK